MPQRSSPTSGEQGMPISSSTMPVPSLLDRLDRDYRGKALLSDQWRFIKQSLIRDIELLFNTRLRRPPASERYDLDRSVVGFGLADFSPYTFRNDADKQRFQRHIVATIHRFEPRLQVVDLELTLDDETHILNMDMTVQYRDNTQLMDITMHSVFDNATRPIRIEERL